MIYAVYVMFIMLWAVPGEAATYYVSNAATNGYAVGNNGNSCTQAQSKTTPKLTIAGGLACYTAANGDFVIVNSGVYDEYITHTAFGSGGVAKSGTNYTNAVTLKSDVLYGAIIRPSAPKLAAFDLVYQTNPLAYVIIDGFDLDGSNISSTSNRGLIKVWGGCGIGWVNHIRFYRNKIHNLLGSAVNTATDGSCTPQNTFLEFIDNILYSNGESTQFSNTFYIQSGQNLFRGNTIRDSLGSAIALSTQNVSAPHDNIVEDNICANLTNSCFLNVEGAARNIYRRNIAYGSLACIHLYASATRTTNAVVYHNTCYGNTRGIYLELAGGAAVRNNITWGNTSSDMTVQGSSGNTMSHNLCGSINSTIGCTVAGNPLFMNTSTRDFTLQSGSPAIDAGINVGLPFSGSAPDLGYWEAGSDTTAPAAPTGVVVS